ncbi:MAG TPA: hypothetical protein VK157_04960 [Phycisphaerales bacterium]|nr:hypothetical protein [Phycisphaerales bacterium]
MAEAKAKHGGRGAQTVKVWAAWAVLFVLSAVAFACCFQMTYAAVLDRARAWAFDLSAAIAESAMLEHQPADVQLDVLRSRIEMLRQSRGLLTYGIASGVDQSSERAFVRLAKTYGLAAFVFVLLCLPVAWLMLWFARVRLQLGRLENDEQMFQWRMLMRLAVPLLLLAAAGGALAAAGLSGTRLLQIRHQPDFNNSAVISERVMYHRDYLGRGIATFISCAAILAIVTWGLYPFFARRTLKQLGRCAKCAYPRGDNATCPECGSSHA